LQISDQGQEVNLKRKTRNSDWILLILKEIRQFSEKDGMIDLAEQIDDTIFIAATEIATRRRLYEQDVES
jgi:hypothetical protein